MQDISSNKLKFNLITSGRSHVKTSWYLSKFLSYLSSSNFTSATCWPFSSGLSVRGDMRSGSSSYRYHARSWLYLDADTCWQVSHALERGSNSCTYLSRRTPSRCEDRKLRTSCSFAPLTDGRSCFRVDIFYAA